MWPVTFLQVLLALLRSPVLGPRIMVKVPEVMVKERRVAGIDIRCNIDRWRNTVSRDHRRVNGLLCIHRLQTFGQIHPYLPAGSQRVGHDDSDHYQLFHCLYYPWELVFSSRLISPKIFALPAFDIFFVIELLHRRLPECVTIDLDFHVSFAVKYQNTRLEINTFIWNL